jgi:hypothetical protein
VTAPARVAVVAAAILVASGYSAAQSTDSAEFAADVKRYEQVVSAVPLTVQVQDCREFESLVAQALSAK